MKNEKEDKQNNLLVEILEIQKKILAVSNDEKAEKAMQAAINFKTKSGIRYITYEKDGDKILCLINTEDNSTIHFKVESILGGINRDKFHPEAMFKPVTTP